MQRTETAKGGLDITQGENGGHWHNDGWSRGHEALPVPTAKLGLWLFLAVVVMLFAALSSAYIVRKGVQDWQDYFVYPLRTLLWLNTVVLLTSSGSLHWSLTSGRRGNITGLKVGLLTTLVLGLIFVSGQVISWMKLVKAGVYLNTNPSSSFFYFLTALHGLHLLGGIVALTWTTVKVWFNGSQQTNLFNAELCALYWHLLSLVWVWLLILMTR